MSRRGMPLWVISDRAVLSHTPPAKFNHNDPQFRDRDLFVFCFNHQDGRFTAHEAMVGQDVRSLRDLKGTWSGEEMYRNAKEGQIVEIDFVSPLPGSTSKAVKRSFITRVGDQVCGVSAYQLNVIVKATPAADGDW
jgi:cytochrome c